MKWLSRMLHGAEHHRAYFYRVAGTVGILLTGEGLITDGTWSRVALVIGAILGVGGNGLATANTSTERPES
jgi:hypothetical protein